MKIRVTAKHVDGSIVSTDIEIDEGETRELNAFSASITVEALAAEEAAAVIPPTDPDAGPPPIDPV